MLEVNHPLIDVDALLARVRQVSAQAAQAPAPPPATPGTGGHGQGEDAGRAPAEGMDRHLEAARASWRVGEHLPPMSRRTGLVRRLAEPTARAFLRLAQLITRDQREFNGAVVGALQVARDALLKAQADARSAERAAAAAGDEARASSARAAEMAAALDRAQQVQGRAIAELQAELARLRDRLARPDAEVPR